MNYNIKHISFKHHFLVDLIDEKKIRLKLTPSITICMGFLTKLVPSHKHILCCKKRQLLNVTNVEEKDMEIS